MQSSLIGKIEKAKRYAREQDRVVFSDFEVSFRGEHNTYITGQNIVVDGGFINV